MFPETLTGSYFTISPTNIRKKIQLHITSFQTDIHVRSNYDD